MTTTDYLTQLQTDKQVLVDNLNAKGVTATNDETFTTLCPKVADISSGGSSEQITITDASYLFFNNARIKEKDTFIKCLGQVTKCTQMFGNVSRGQNIDISNADFSKCSDFSSFFSHYMATLSYEKDKIIMPKDLSSATTFSRAFSFRHIELDMSKTVTLNSIDCSYMFENTYIRSNALQFANMKVSNANGMFNAINIGNSSWEQLETLDLSNLDFSSCTNFDSMFNKAKVKNIVGTIDVNKITGTIYNLLSSNIETVYIKNLKASLPITMATSLTAESIDYLLNNVQDVTASPKTITLGETNKAKASAEAIAHAESLGWTIS